MKSVKVGARLYRKAPLVIAMASVLALSACGQSGSAEQAAEPGPPEEVSQSEWDEIVEAANEEGSVVVYSGLSDVEGTFGEFERLYPDISVTVERAPTSDLISRMDQEMEVNAVGADVAFITQKGWFDERYEEDRFAALKISPELAESEWMDSFDGDGYATAFAIAYVLGYNTATSEPPTSVEELVEMAEGKRVGIPDAAITPQQTYLYSTWMETYGDDFLERIAELDHSVYGSNVPLAQGLAAGEIDYGLGLTASTIISLQEEGAPVDYVTTDDTRVGVPTYAAPLASAGNPNASQVFINWLVGEGGANQFVANHAPASTPVSVEGSIPWGQLADAAQLGWGVDEHQSFIEETWTPNFG